MGHWYDASGLPAHTVIGKNGKERDTTMRDARKKDLVPSVSGIISVLDKPALLNWKIGNTLKEAAKRPFCPEWEGYEEWCKLINAITSQNKAANKGSLIHNELEYFYRKGEIRKQEYSQYIIKVDEALVRRFGNDRNWIAEKSFRHADGFGGTCDLHSESGIIIDFKTKEDFSKAKAYNEHAMQLAAYKKGFGMKKATCHNLFISTDDDNNVQLKWHDWDKEEIDRAAKMFDCLLGYWKLANNF